MQHNTDSLLLNLIIFPNSRLLTDYKTSVRNSWSKMSEPGHEAKDVTYEGCIYFCNKYGHQQMMDKDQSMSR